MVSHFFAMCRKFGVSWSKASEEQKAFIEKLPESIMKEKKRSEA